MKKPRCLTFAIFFYQFKKLRNAMSLIPNSLFNITLDFVSTNVEYIDNLIGFPEVVGRKIFDRFLNFNELSLSPSDKQAKVIRNFAKAYEELLLQSIELSNGLILINEYFSSFIELFSFISELCLCSCHLGDNHELFEHIQNFNLLKKLCLKRNCLKDGAIRKITLPIRMFNKGPKHIEYLDLSDNKCTDAIVPWLAVFQSLLRLDLSGTNLTKNGIKNIEKKCSLQLCHTESNIHPISTKGWAESLVKKWKDLQISRKEARKHKEFKSYFKKKRYLMAEEVLVTSLEKVSNNKIVLKKREFDVKSCLVKAVASGSNDCCTKKKPVSYTEDIEDDIFLQYLKKQ